MKKTILLLLIGVFSLSFAIEKDSIIIAKPFTLHYVKKKDFYFCDTCGGANAGGGMGFSSILNSNFIGLRYLSQSYKSNDGLYSNSPWFNQNVNTVQLWAKIPVFKKMQLSVFVPYNLFFQESRTGEQRINGLGDATILALYEVFKTKKERPLYDHSVQIGGGLKLPTGKFNKERAGTINPNFQVGSGSWDYIVAADYTIKKNKLGLNSTLNYIFKTENAKNYRFGNQFNYGTTLFYIFDKTKYTFVPQVGVSGEVYDKNYQFSQEIRKTGGSVLFSKVGLEIGKNRLSVGVNAMLPLSQNLNSGNLKANYRYSIALNYSL